jgi:hypothetical protein
LLGRSAAAKLGRLVLCLLLAVVALAAGLNAAANVWSWTDPDRTLRFWPGEPIALVRRQDLRWEQHGGGIDHPAVMAATARRSLRQAPLNASALRQLGLVEAYNSRLDNALVLMRLAHQLSRHDVGTLLWSIYGSAMANEVEATLEYCDEALTIDEDVGETLYPHLVKMLANSVSRRTLILYLRGDRPWMPAFLRYAIRAPNSSPDIASLIISAGGLPRSWRYDGIDAQLLARLSDRRQFASARNYLRSLTGKNSDIAEDVRVTSDTVDPRLGPFAWTLVDQADYGALLDERRGIVVRASADKQGRVASRILLLRPGSYLLTQRVRSPPGLARADLGWELSCLGGNNPVVWKASIPAHPTATLYRSDILVSQDCPAQQLWLMAGSNDNQGDAQVVINGLALLRR